MENFKNIHIGSLIRQKVEESEIEMDRMCNFLKCSEMEIEKMYNEMDLPTNTLLVWSKLLEYDFFRIYTQHLILYSPPSLLYSKEQKFENQNPLLPKFRKNIYTIELIDFILEMIQTGEKTKSQVISEYGIPKTTLFKWIQKYSKN
ncbi:transposase [Chryseobacterium oncorhynchi]|uniref:Transposase n=1 Tax=Chryseobacterium oncorhynchi TaxID=741074 RepID=A0A316X2P8_9FLAO|nr:transposase [Chryseobacterium oncorhynchi]PWN67804.1 transposase [Chryseobacterium oncorhynchi]